MLYVFNLGFFEWCMCITYFIENMKERGIAFVLFIAFVTRIPVLLS